MTPDLASTVSTSTYSGAPPDQASRSLSSSALPPAPDSDSTAGFTPEPVARPYRNAKVCRVGPSSAMNASRLKPSEPSQDSCCEEVFLAETSSDPGFDERMSSLGFHRSPTQPNTIGDGACGVRALCDQLNVSSDDAMFGRDDHQFARRYITMQARDMVRRGELDSAFFVPNVKEWCLRMAKNAEFVDNLFLMVFALVQERDIIIIPVHRGSSAGTLNAGNGDFRWIRGNET